MAGPLLDELSSVLDCVLMHLESEDKCDPERSLYELQRAHGYLTFTLAIHLVPGAGSSQAGDGLTQDTVSLLAAVCQGLLHTYEERILVGGNATWTNKQLQQAGHRRACAC
jgi:hypothetical protein